MYLPEPATLAIVIGPIKHNVLEAFGQLQTRVGALQARPGAVGRFGWGRDSLNPPALAVKGKEGLLMRSSLVCRSSQPRAGIRASTGSMRCSCARSPG